VLNELRKDLLAGNDVGKTDEIDVDYEASDGVREPGYAVDDGGR